MKYEDGTTTEIVDDLKKADHPMKLLDQKWKGITRLEKNHGSNVPNQGQGKQVGSSEHFIDPDLIDVFEAQLINKEGGGEASSHVTFQSENHSDFDEASASISSHAVPDTACRKTLIGQYTLRDMERHVHERGLKVIRSKCLNAFQCGNEGGTDVHRSSAHSSVHRGYTGGDQSSCASWYGGKDSFTVVKGISEVAWMSDEHG